MKLVINIISNSLKLFFLGGILSNLFLVILVFSDSYFRYLDFSEENFHQEIVKYFWFTVYVPLILIIIYMLFMVYQKIQIFDKIVVGISGLLGIILFVFLERYIKKYALIHEYLILSMFLLIFGYLFLFYIIKFINKKYQEVNS
jgi:hypothetical protein